MSRWPKVTLGQVSGVISGQSPPGTSYNDRREGLPFFQGKAEFGDIHPTPKKWCTEPKKISEAGDILISVRAPVGPTNIADERCCIGRGLAAVRVDRTRADRDFIHFYLQFIEPLLASRGQGSTFSAINRADLLSLAVPLPPLPEQRRIVDILNRADGIRRLRREAQAKARQLIPAVFVEVFGDPATNQKGWEIISVGDALDATDYGTSKKASTEPGGLPVIRMGNVNVQGDLDLTDLKYVHLEDDELEKQRLVSGDLLFNRTNSKELVGKTGLWDDRFDAVAASYFIRLRCRSDKIEPSYLWAFFNTQYMKRRLFETARGAIGQANINAKEVRAFKVQAPPLALQNAFAERVADIQSLIAQHAAMAVKAEAMMRSLMSHVFDG